MTVTTQTLAHASAVDRTALAIGQALTHWAERRVLASRGIGMRALELEAQRAERERAALRHHTASIR